MFILFSYPLWDLITQNRQKNVKVGDFYWLCAENLGTQGVSKASSFLTGIKGLMMLHSVAVQ